MNSRTVLRGCSIREPFGDNIWTGYCSEKSMSFSSTLIKSTCSLGISFEEGLEWLNEETVLELLLVLTTLLYVICVTKYPQDSGLVGAVAPLGAGSHLATGCPYPSPFVIAL